MDKQEILKLREHLRRSLGCPGVNVVPTSRAEDAAEVQLGERRIGLITADEEDGDRSFFFEMQAPVVSCLGLSAETLVERPAQIQPSARTAPSTTTPIRYKTFLFIAPPRGTRIAPTPGKPRRRGPPRL